MHQILSLLGQKVHVPAEAKSRMYHLVRGRESIPPPRPDGYKPPPPEPVTKPIQPWVAPVPPERHWVERFGPLAGCLALIAILCWSAYESISPPKPEALALEAPAVLTPAPAPLKGGGAPGTGIAAPGVAGAGYRTCGSSGDIGSFQATHGWRAEEGDAHDGDSPDSRTRCRASASRSGRLRRSG